MGGEHPQIRSSTAPLGGIRCAVLTRDASGGPTRQNARRSCRSYGACLCEIHWARNGWRLYDPWPLSTAYSK